MQENSFYLRLQINKIFRNGYLEKCDIETIFQQWKNPQNLDEMLERLDEFSQQSEEKYDLEIIDILKKHFAIEISFVILNEILQKSDKNQETILRLCDIIIQISKKYQIFFKNDSKIQKAYEYDAIQKLIKLMNQKIKQFYLCKNYLITYKLAEISLRFDLQLKFLDICLQLNIHELLEKGLSDDEKNLIKIATIQNLLKDQSVDSKLIQHLEQQIERDYLGDFERCLLDLILQKDDYEFCSIKIVKYLFHKLMKSQQDFLIFWNLKNPVDSNIVIFYVISHYLSNDHQWQKHGSIQIIQDRNNIIEQFFQKGLQNDQIPIKKFLYAQILKKFKLNFRNKLKDQQMINDLMVAKFRSDNLNDFLNQFQNQSIADNVIQYKILKNILLLNEQTDYYLQSIISPEYLIKALEHYPRSIPYVFKLIKQMLYVDYNQLLNEFLLKNSKENYDQQFINLAAKMFLHEKQSCKQIFNHKSILKDDVLNLINNLKLVQDIKNCQDICEIKQKVEIIKQYIDDEFVLIRNYKQTSFSQYQQKWLHIFYSYYELKNNQILSNIWNDSNQDNQTIIKLLRFQLSYKIKTFDKEIVQDMLQKIEQNIKKQTFNFWKILQSFYYFKQKQFQQIDDEDFEFLSDLIFLHKNTKHFLSNNIQIGMKHKIIKALLFDECNSVQLNLNMLDELFKKNKIQYSCKQSEVLFSLNRLLKFYHSKNLVIKNEDIIKFYNQNLFESVYLKQVQDTKFVNDPFVKDNFIKTKCTFHFEQIFCYLILLIQNVSLQSKNKDNLIKFFKSQLKNNRIDNFINILTLVYQIEAQFFTKLKQKSFKLQMHEIVNLKTSIQFTNQIENVYQNHFFKQYKLINQHYNNLNDNYEIQDDKYNHINDENFINKQEEDYYQQINELDNSINKQNIKYSNIQNSLQKNINIDHELNSNVIDTVYQINEINQQNYFKNQNENNIKESINDRQNNVTDNLINNQNISFDNILQVNLFQNCFDQVKFTDVYSCEMFIFLNEQLIRIEQNLFDKKNEKNFSERSLQFMNILEQDSMFSYQYINMSLLLVSQMIHFLKKHKNREIKHLKKVKISQMVCGKQQEIIDRIINIIEKSYKECKAFNEDILFQILNLYIDYFQKEQNTDLFEILFKLFIQECKTTNSHKQLIAKILRSQNILYQKISKLINQNDLVKLTDLLMFQDFILHEIRANEQEDVQIIQIERFKMQVGLENYSNNIGILKKDDFLIVMKYGLFNFTKNEQRFIINSLDQQQKNIVVHESFNHKVEQTFRILITFIEDKIYDVQTNYHKSYKMIRIILNLFETFPYLMINMYKQQQNIKLMEFLILNLEKYFQIGIQIVKLIIISLKNYYQLKDQSIFYEKIFDKILNIFEQTMIQNDNPVLGRLQLELLQNCIECFLLKYKMTQEILILINKIKKIMESYYENLFKQPDLIRNKIKQIGFCNILHSIIKLQYTERRIKIIHYQDQNFLTKFDDHIRKNKFLIDFIMYQRYIFIIVCVQINNQQNFYIDYHLRIRISHI